MSESDVPGMDKVVPRSDFGVLFDVLKAAGYSVIAPTVRDAAITYDQVSGVDDLPIGWSDHQSPGGYHLERRDDEACFGYVVGQSTWKRFLYPPQSELVHIRRTESGDLAFSEPYQEQRRYAFIGVRGCEMAAIAIQDRVFLESGYVDRTYQNNRRDLFTVAVNCVVVGGNCFCVSMGTGPENTAGYDIVITEVLNGETHEFVCRSGSAAGAEVLEQMPGRPAEREDHAAVGELMAASTRSMGRSLDTDGIKEMLYAAFDHPQWDDVASRCLACTNCTLVCPTCFCSTTEDTASLDGTSATRSRRWDSCFTCDFSALHGAPVRQTIKARYRQWMTHKLAAWYDQFGTSGCVGCGRCITWCPVGIDITAEAAAIREGSEAPV